MSHPSSDHRTRSSHGKTRAKRAFAFGPLNFALLVAGAIVVIAGYVLLDRGSITAAPLLLVVGYAVLLPAGILAGWRRIDPDEE